MIEVDGAVVSATVAAGAAGFAAMLSYRSSTQANRASSRKVDIDEFTAAKDALQQIIAEQDKHNERLRTQLDRMNAQMDNVQSALAREQDVSHALRNELRALHGQVRALEVLVDAPLALRSKLPIARDGAPPSKGEKP